MNKPRVLLNGRLRVTWREAKVTSRNLSYACCWEGQEKAKDGELVVLSHWGETGAGSRGKASGGMLLL